MKWVPRVSPFYSLNSTLPVETSILRMPVQATCKSWSTSLTRGISIIWAVQSENPEILAVKLRKSLTSTCMTRKRGSSKQREKRRSSSWFKAHLMIKIGALQKGAKCKVCFPDNLTTLFQTNTLFRNSTLPLLYNKAQSDQERMRSLATIAWLGSPISFVALDAISIIWSKSQRIGSAVLLGTSALHVEPISSSVITPARGSSRTCQEITSAEE